MARGVFVGWVMIVGDEVLKLWALSRGSFSLGVELLVLFWKAIARSATRVIAEIVMNKVFFII